MTTPTQAPDTCNAQEKFGSKLFICELPLRHQGEDHRQGDFAWKERSW